MWGFGTDESLGHIDFYPQGAQAYLCPPLPVFGASCEHMAAHELFMESIYKHYACVMKAWRCTSWNHFSAGLCDTSGENSLQMGYFLTKEEWLATQKASPSIGEIVSDGLSKITDSVVSKLPELPSIMSSTAEVDSYLPNAVPENESTDPTTPNLWNFGMMLLHYVKGSLLSNDSSLANNDEASAGNFRLLERLPIVGQFFLSNEEDVYETTAGENGTSSRNLKVKKSKNNYYLHVRRIYPYCVSEVEQLRMTQPETCSESGINPV